jgi:hypothetical protein
VTNETTPLLATAYRSGGDPIEWVLHDVNARQAVMVRAFLRWSYGRSPVIVSFIGREMFADFVAQYGEEYEDLVRPEMLGSGLGLAIRVHVASPNGPTGRTSADRRHTGSCPSALFGECRRHHASAQPRR